MQRDIKASQRADGRWEAKGRDPMTGKRKSFYARSKEEAESKALESIRLSSYETLAGYFYSVYLPKLVNRSRGWQDQVIYAMEKLVLPKFGHLELVALTRPMLQAAFTDWARERKPNGEFRFKKVSLDKVKIVFGGILRLAEDDDLISKNPLKRVDVTGRPSEPKVILAADELWKLYEAADQATKPVILLTGFCGLRIGEATGVMRNAIDDRGILEIRQQVLQYSGGCRISNTLKTDQSRRRIPLPTELREAMLNSEKPSLFVCSDSKGSYLTPNNATRGLQAACKRAGVPVITPHNLRHTFISLMENEVVAPIRVVEELAGKAKRGNTAGYSQAQDETKRDWMRKYWEKAKTSFEERKEQVQNIQTA